MASLTSKSLIRVAGEPAALAAYIGGLTVGLAALVCAVSVHPRVFTAVIEGDAVADRLERPLMLDMAAVAWSIAWPVTCARPMPRASGGGAARPAALGAKTWAAETAGDLDGRWT
ncbi:hypothetical protein AB0K60_32740 [Thermopolyspora sp. NPDC052614]|uniref:hypothetical protein n=1 Tax=Thermopolyspora sp. NPDC052614 TaxID=3155682 RepID=UPI0034223313